MQLYGEFAAEPLWVDILHFVLMMEAAEHSWMKIIW